MQKRFGFSRWELLALGATSCVVSAVLVPVLAQTSNRRQPTSTERTAMCVNNLKQVALGFAQYTNDFDERYPLVVSGNTEIGSMSAYGWADSVMPYIRSTQVYQCPSERNRGQNDPTMRGYTDYWYNAHLSRVDFSVLQAPMLNLLAGDGDGGSFNSNARYNLKSLPKSWIKTVNSPARRHTNQGCYAFADWHVECLPANEAGTKAATFKLR